MKTYIKSVVAKGAVKRLCDRINEIIDNDPFVVDVTAVEDYPDNRSFVTSPEGKVIIYLGQAIVDIVKDFYK